MIFNVRQGIVDVEKSGKKVKIRYMDMGHNKDAALLGIKVRPCH